MKSALSSVIGLLTRPAIAALLAAGAASASAAPITPGNLVAVRVGDGVAALGTSATAVFLDEFTTSGSLVQSIALPVAAAGSNRICTLGGTATSEGFVTQSVDGRYLLVAGYNKAVGGTTPSSDASTTTNRVVARVEIATGIVDTSTALTDAASASNVRAAVSVDGTSFWVSGGAGAVRYAPLAATTSTQLTTTLTNFRVVNVFGGQLWASSSSTTFLGISAVGSGLPTTAGQTTVQLPGFFTSGTHSTYDFFFAGPGTIYLSDDGSVASGGGVQKWVLNGSTWVQAYTLTTGLPSAGGRGLSGYVNSAGNTVLYLVTTDNTSSNNRIVTLTDTGLASVFTNLPSQVTAGVNKGFRGVRVVAQPSIDGTVDAPLYGTALGVQAAPTLYGDETGGSTGCAAIGSELDNASAVIRDGTLYLHLAGNLQTNGNKLVVFVDSAAGGQNALRGDNDGGNTLSHLGANGGGLGNGGPGLTFDSGFSPDYAIALNATCSGPFTLFADLFTLPTSSGGTKTFLGQTGTAAGSGVLTGGTNPNSILVTIDNSNTGGVDGASAANAASAVRGAELAIPLTAIGLPAGAVRVCALVTDANYDAMSNQVLGTLAAGATNYGSGSYRNFASDSDAPGNQYLTASTGCTPASITAQPPASLTVCTGSVASITAAGSGSGVGYTWQQSTDGGTTWVAAAGTNTFTATMVTATAAANNTQFRCVVSGTCGAAISSTTVLTVGAGTLPATPTSPLASNPFISAGGSCSLSATVAAGETVDWYAVACGSTFVGSGSPLVVMPTATTTYFAQARNTTSGCRSAACASVTVSVGAGAPVVISQIYSRANLTSPTSSYNRNYIELYNRSSSPVDLSNWSLQVTTSGTGTTWNSLSLAGSIPANGYYLIATTPVVGANGAGLPTPNATFLSAIALSSTDGKVALVSNQVVLGAVSCFAPGTNGILDMVGWGTAANCFEGSGPAPANGVNTAATLRLAGGQDTNDNTADFSTAAPNPRNSSAGTTPPSSPVGSCCLPSGSCAMMTSSACNSAGGFYGGDDTTCPTPNYVFAGRTAAIADDISTTGTSFALTNGTLDDGNQMAIPLGFTFSYFGNARTTINICTNGFLFFGTTSATSTSGTVPSTSTPNEVVAPYWVDMLIGSAGVIRYQTLGAAPGRRFIAQWTNAPRYLSGSPTGSNTFQAILYEGSNAIEYRYGVLNAGSATTVPAIGVENITGGVGVAVAAGAVGAGGAGAAQIFTPTYSKCAQPTGACCTGTSCSVTTVLACQLAGGSYQGNGTNCDVNPCTPPGACCLGNGTCSILTVAACSAAGGLFNGEGSTCTAGLCVGSCYLPDGTCSVLGPTPCASAGGSYQGNGTTCPASGACCFGNGTCRITINVGPYSCSNLGGAYGGDGSACGTIGYAAPVTSYPVFEDISATGTPMVLSNGSLDDGNQTNIPLGFTFNYYGSAKTTISICTNGFLYFSTGSFTSTSGTIPSTATPNDTLAPFWVDLLAANLNQIRFQTLGTAPARRFIAQWTAVPRYLSGSPTGSNTFQVVLFEGSDAISYRYGVLNAGTQTTVPTIGVENAAGTVATSVTPASIGSGNTVRIFAPSGSTCAQPTGGCCFPDGTCGLREGPTCALQGGTYRGHGTDCSASCPVLTTPIAGTGAASPGNVLPGANVLLTVTVTPGTNPPSTGIVVLANLTSIGGSATQSLFDDGPAGGHGDGTAGDNVFSYLATVAPATPPGAKVIPMAISDAQSRTASTSAGFNVNPANDACAGAEAVSDGSYARSNAGAQTNTPSPDCPSVGSNSDVWFSYTACSSGSVVVDTCGSQNLTGGIDTVLSVFDGCGGTPAQLACNDDNGGTLTCATVNSHDSRVTFTAVAGSTYRIRVSSYSTTVQGNFILNIAGPQVAAPTAPSATPSTVCLGGSVTLAATVNAGETVDWFTGSCGGTPAGSGPSISVTPAGSATYYARARNTTSGCVSATCASVAVVVNTPPSITAQPSDATTCFGTGAPFSVTAGGAAPLTYEWQQSTDGGFNWVGSDGTNTNTDTMTSAPSAADDTRFRVIVRDVNGCSTISSPAALHVNPLPPAPDVAGATTICPSESATLSATAPAGQTVYWFSGTCGGTPEGTGPSIIVTPAGTTTYYARARNDATACDGPCASVTVTVRDPVAITVGPSDQTVCTGQAFSFSVTATGSELSYQWRRNGVDIGGANGPSYASVGSTSTAGSYTVLVSNPCGSVESSPPAVLTVNGPPTIDTQPVSHTGCLGQSTSFSVVASGAGTLTYQWRKDGVAISGATSDTYTIASVGLADAGSYDVLVSNDCGATLSSTATLSISACGPVIYVNHAATGANNGATWADAFTDLQDGLLYANSGQDVWVASGTYRPDRGSGDRSASFFVPGGVRLLGGFAGTESSAGQADPAAHPTALSGEIGAPGNADNSSHIVSVVSGGAAATLDGFTVSGGSAEVSAGGGLLIASDASASRMIVSGNTANTAGGVYISSGVVTLSNSLLTGNTSVQNGGALATGGGTVTLSNCTIARNGSVAGTGGVLNNGASLTVANSVLWENGAAAQAANLLSLSGSRSVSYSCIQGWDGSLGGAGNHGSDPRFLNAAGGDFRVRPCGSPVVDAGSNAAVTPGTVTDLAGNPRFRDDPNLRDTGFGTPPIVDMGAYEQQGGSCRADFNCDGAVNVGDYLAFLAGYSAADPRADMNNDGQVNVADYLRFLQLYSAGC